MQAITTKFLGSTNHRGSRVKATCQAKSMIVPWDDALDIDDNHDVAAKMLAESLSWGGEWHRGGLPSGEGNVYVIGSKRGAFKVKHLTGR